MSIGGDMFLLGADKGIANCLRVGRNLALAKADACMAAGHVFEAEAKRLCPVDTGFLRSTIQTRRKGMDAAEVTPTAEYAGFVEFGTVNQSAQPYMRPAYENKKEQATAVLAGRLRRGLTTVGASGSISMDVADQYTQELPST